MDAQASRTGCGDRVNPRVIILMGVAGSGKTTIGRLLARTVQWEFQDGDDFHPQANVDKMASAHPLTDEDRAPWLARMKASIAEWVSSNRRVVLAASLLKAEYRSFVLDGVVDAVRLVSLEADAALLHTRLAHRAGHFMPEALLDSQLAIVEPPLNALRVDASQAPDEIVRRIRAGLGL